MRESPTPQYVEIRIFGVGKKGIVDPKPLHHYISTAVPRMDDYICIQANMAIVISVEWTILQRANVDVFCDLTDMRRGMKDKAK